MKGGAPGSFGLEEHRLQEASSPDGGGQAQSRSGGCQRQTLPEHHPENGRPAGTQGDSQTDFPRALFNGMRHDAVHTCDR